MPAFERPIALTLLDRLREAPRTLIYVAGPRQSGKTTLVLQTLRRIRRRSDYFPVDAADTALPLITPLAELKSGNSSPPVEVGLPPIGLRDARWLVRLWEQARLKAKASDRGFVLVLDEIQKIANWSETVKGLWDADRIQDLPLHVVLLGSAPLRIQKGLSESLAGRFEELSVRHWSFGEMVAAFDFDLDQYVYFGGYPGSVPYVKDEARWHEYIHRTLIEPTIERDVLALERVTKPILFKQLFELASAYSGQIFSYNKMLGQLDDAGNTTTLARYLDLLSKVGLIAGLPNYSRNKYRRRASSPKLNVLNTALMSAHADYTFEQARNDRTFWGRIVESAVGAHLINSGNFLHRVHYWRDSKGNEVDFVLTYGREAIAFEVKSGNQFGRGRGLRAFTQRFPEAKTHVVGHTGIPISEFLLTPVVEWFERP